MRDLVNRDYIVKLHKNGKYAYASTQPFVGYHEGRRCYNRKHWGIVDENFKFIPNKEFQLLTKKEKNKFKFPEFWDLSDIYIEKQKLDNQSYNKLYGEIWLLENIAKKLGIQDDLMATFKDADTVNAILTLVYYRICSDDTYNHVVNWQKVTKVPCDYELNEVLITRLTKKITENDKMKFLAKRLDRIDKNEICCIDSTSISCTSDTFADAFMGVNKEGDTLMQTNEVYVYGLKSKLPLYYRTVPGNMRDSRSLKIIVNDLAAIGLEKCLMITDRGYDSTENMDYYKKNNISFITGIKSANKAVLENLRNEFDLSTIFIPVGYESDEHSGLFGKQYDLGDDLKLNIYINLTVRADIFKETYRIMTRQKNLLTKLKTTGHRCDKPLITRISSYFNVEFQKKGRFQTVKDFTFNEKRYINMTELAGIYASMSYKVKTDVHTINELYRKRTEQEKVFMYHKTFLNNRRHRTSTEETKIGRNFINFIASYLTCYIQNIRKERLGGVYPDIKSLLREMRPIRYVTHPNREDMITPFVSRQISIANVFGLEGVDIGEYGKKCGQALLGY